MIFVTGRRTSIVRELEALLPEGEQLVPSVHSRAIDLERAGTIGGIGGIPKVQRYLFAAGVMIGKPIGEQTEAEQCCTMAINCLNPIAMCENILTHQAAARICVIGSESAYLGSYDQVYAASKAALQAYVAARALKSNQQLICIAPPLISDAGMTMRRHDYPQVLEQRRTVTSLQVAQLIRTVLFGWGRDSFGVRFLTVET